jgi:two-component system, cell cycle response regulator DivK
MSDNLILLVEDNANNRLLVRDVLQATGYETVEAETAEDGIRLALDRQPALILMDILLPAMNGMEALRRLRDEPRTREIPVIAITASVMDQDRSRIMAAGFDDYISKPINVRAFLDTVRAILARHRRSPEPS